jgi:hypothetical protein
MKEKGARSLNLMKFQDLERPVGLRKAMISQSKIIHFYCSILEREKKRHLSSSAMIY